MTVAFELTTHTQNLLHRLQNLLPLTEDEIVQRGITEATMARIMELRQQAAQLASMYTSLENLEQKVKAEGVSPDDHTFYTDLIEWRAVRQELADLTAFLESV
jgi:hypothetical protein